MSPHPIGWVLLPAHQEATVIGQTVSQLVQAGYQVLVVDDGSQDGSGELAQQHGAKVLQHRINLGQGAALETGMAWLRTQPVDWVVHFDADGQHDVADISRLVEKLDQVDVAMGSRFLPGGSAENLPRSRKWVLRLARLFHGLTTGLWLSDAHCGLRALNNKALQAIRLEEPGMAHASEILTRIQQTGLRWEEVPVRVRYTEYSLQKGQTNRQAWHILQALVTRWLL